MSKSVLVLYHGQCADGFGAAWAAQLCLGDRAEYLPVQYGMIPPDVTGVQRLYILDFSYPLETMERLASRVESVTVIDHHASAEPVLQQFRHSVGGVGDVIFDSNASGSVLAWKFFHPRKPVPQLLLYVQDRDLWRWKLPDSREVSAALRSYPFDFEVWNRLAGNSGGLIDEGRTILRYQAQQVAAHIKNARLQVVAGHEVPVVNATTLMSEIGEALCTQFPDAPFSASYFVRKDGKRIWSLRSRGGFDVGALAKTQGGGGHPAAAGFEEVL